MPDMSPTEMILGALAALFGGGTGATVIKSRTIVTAEVEKRFARFEKRLATTEERMQSVQSAIASIAHLRDTTDRTWRAIEAIAEKIERLSQDVVRLHVETTIDRELRKKHEEDMNP